MNYSDELVAELDVLMLFEHASTQEGIKIHKEAAVTTIEAAKRLHDKGFITQADGGYLTDIGIEAAEYALKLHMLLTAG